MPQYVYKTCLVLFVLSLSSFSIELSFATSIVVILLSSTQKIDRNLLISTNLILVVAIVGLISCRWLKHSFYDIFKDIIYFVRPITILLASYFLVKRIKSKTYVFNAIIIIALFFALKHLYVIVTHIGSIDSYVYLRSLGGKQNHIEAVALIFLMFTSFNTVFIKYRKLIIFIIFMSFVLYLSRTMYIILFLYFLGYKGYLILNKKLVKGLFIFSIAALIISVSISKVDTNRDSKGVRGFIYKTQNSFTEMFASFDTDKIKRDRRALWEHWRAYEAQKAIEQLNENGRTAWLFGMGYGEKVVLDTYVRLAGQNYTEVPSIHNGFIFVIFKTGIIGFFFYLVFMLRIFITHQNVKHNKKLFNNLIIATSLYMLINSLVITGFYRPGEFSIFLFGILIATKTKFVINSSLNKEN